MKKNNLLVILAVVCVLFLFSMACKQSGEIITSAEATQRYEATQAAIPGDVIVEVEGAAFASGDVVNLKSAGHLVGLFREAGARTAFSYATRGDEVTVVSSVDFEGETWYKIESTAGDGWLPETNLIAE
jgi:hypothetical protein